jgi:hypothetical protein
VRVFPADRYVIIRDSFCLHKIPNFFSSHSLGTYIYYNVRCCLFVSRMLLSFWHFLYQAYTHIIMLSCHSSSLQPSFSFSFSSRVCVSLTLTVVQYERSIVRHHHHLLVSTIPTVLSNKHNTHDRQ